MKTQAADRLKEMLRVGPLERFQIEARMGSRGAAANALGRLIKRGEVERTSDGRWQLRAAEGARHGEGVEA